MSGEFVDVDDVDDAIQFVKTKPGKALVFDTDALLDTTWFATHDGDEWHVCQEAGRHRQATDEQQIRIAFGIYDSVKVTNLANIPEAIHL
jgi:hypothetical protein